MKAVFLGDDPRARQEVMFAVSLRWPDEIMLSASQAREGLELVEREAPDIVLVHSYLTDMTAVETIQALRGFTNVLLMVLGSPRNRSENEMHMEFISCIEEGADGYIRLPCETSELAVQIWVLLRRQEISSISPSERSLRNGRLFINSATYEVFLRDQQVALTSTEFRFLHLLVRHADRVVSYDEMQRSFWREGAENLDSIKQYVRRIRHKLGDNVRQPVWIANVRGVGYKFIGVYQKSSSGN